MLESPSETLTLSKIYNVPPEDILFLDFSLSGIKFHLPYSRIRFEFIPVNRPYFETSFKMNTTKYFFALPTNSNSPYHIKCGYLTAKREIIGHVKNLANDTCDSSYPRREGTVLNLNPVSKSLCHGCKFCHTLLQEAQDIEEALQSEPDLRRFIKTWLEKCKIPDLSHIIQVAIVTGCFGSEQKVIEWLKMARKVLDEYKFNGELFYYGSEIITEKALDELKDVKPFGLCLSLECFENREWMLRNIKARITIEDAKRILARATERGFRTNFSYILGLELLDAMEKGFEELLPHINSFPVINILQVHRGQDKLRCADAWNIDYYMKARKRLEEMFETTGMRPRSWENYRSLWYLKFGDEVLDDIRTP